MVEWSNTGLVLKRLVVTEIGIRTRKVLDVIFSSLEILNINIQGGQTN